jgi:hypothetical protein
MSKAADLARTASASETALSNRNILYNGSMEISQRATSVTGIGASNGYFTLDRWQIQASNTAGRLTMTQTADGPSGFATCLKLDCTTADTSVAAAESLQLTQSLEGFDVQQLKKGTASAEQITISFYVKGNASATYVAEMYDLDSDTHINKTFSVTTSWTRIELTYVGDTSNPFDNNNGGSLQFNIWLHAGSNFTSGTIQYPWGAGNNPGRAAGITSFFDSTNRTFFITGVQMEAGPVATPFEHRSYGQELALCQRYYEAVNWAMGFSYSTSSINFDIPFSVYKRINPSVTVLDSSITVDSAGVGANTSSGSSIAGSNLKQGMASIRLQGFSVTSQRAYPTWGQTDNFLGFDAEL